MFRASSTGAPLGEPVVSAQRSAIPSVFASMEECNAGQFARARVCIQDGIRIARKYGFRYYSGVAVRAASYFAAMRGEGATCWRLYGASQALRDRIPFSSRGMHRAADHLLNDAKIALPAEDISALTEEGIRMEPEEAYDLAVEALASEVALAVS